MTKNERVFELLSNNDLTWTVNRLPLIGRTTNDDGIITELETNSFGNFRNDTGEHLGTVGEKYQVFQNYELAETIVEASEGMNLEVSRGGMLQNGKKVYLQIGLPDELIGESKVKRYITALNSHDGSSSIGFGTSNTVVICQNTFNKSMRDVSRIRHTMTAKERVTAAMEDIRRSILGEEMIMTQFKQMCDTKLEDEILEKIIKSCFKVTDVNEAPSTRKMNQMTQVAADIATDVKIHGNNLWALFNGITRYTNHHMVKPDKQAEHLMVGQGAKINAVAFDTIMNWVDDRSYKQHLMMSGI